MTEDHRAFGVHPTIPFRLFNKEEMAKLLGCTVRTIDRMVTNHKIPFLRIPSGGGSGTKVKFDSRDIERWLSEHHHDVIDVKEEIRRFQLRQH